MKRFEAVRYMLGALASILLFPTREPEVKTGAIKPGASISGIKYASLRGLSREEMDTATADALLRAIKSGHPISKAMQSAVLNA